MFHPYSGAWQPGGHGRLSGAPRGGQSSDDQTSYKGIRSEKPGRKYDPPDQRDYSRSNGADRNGNVGDRPGDRGGDEAGCGDGGGRSGGQKYPEAEQDRADHRYGNSSGIRRAESPNRSYGGKPAGEGDRDRRPHSS